MEERVVLTAELQDEISAPLDNTSRKIDQAADRAIRATQKQATATQRAMGQITSSTTGPTTGLNRIMGVMERIGTGGAAFIRNGIIKPLGAAGDAVGRAVGTVASGVGNVAGSAARMVRNVSVGVAAVGGIIAGLALKGGINRALAIEDAQASLAGLGHSAETVQTIMTNATSAVKGTAFGLGDAAGVAASAVAAGIQPGEDLTRILTLMGDAATIAKTDMGSMGSIFNKVAASGKMQGDVIAQLGDMGVPILQFVAKEMGVTAEEAAKLASDGKVNFEIFANAMEAGLGGAAQSSGKTFRGAWANTKAALGRVGATVAIPFLASIKEGFNQAMPFIDGLNERLKPVMVGVETWLSANAPAAFERFFSAANKGVGIAFAFAAALSNDRTKITPDLVREAGLDPSQGFGLAVNEALGSIFAFQAAWIANDGEVTSSGMPGFFERFGYQARQAFEITKTGIAAFREEWTNSDGVITSSGFPGFMERTAIALRMVTDYARQLDFSSWQAFVGSMGAGEGVSASLGSIGTSFQTLQPAFRAFADELPGFGGALATLAASGLTLVARAMGFLADNVGTIITLMPFIVAAFVGWRIASMALAQSQMRLQWAQLAMTPVITANNIMRLIAIRLEGQQAATSLAAATAADVNTAATGRQTLAQRVATIATLAMNAAMRLNPIGLIITAITLLVGALVWFFTQTEAGQVIITNVWAGIQTAIGAVVDWFNGTAMPIIRAAIDGISAGFTWFYENVLTPIWNGVKFYIETWAAIFTWLYETIFQPVFSGIGTVLNAFWLLASGVFNLVVAIITKVLVPIFMSFWNDTIAPVFTWIGDKISTWWTAAQLVFGIAVAFVRDTLGAIFTWLWESIISPVFQWIGDRIALFWTGAQIIFGYLVSYFNDTLGPIFNWLYDTIIKPVWDSVGTKIAGVYNDHVKPIFDSLRTAIEETIPKAFDTGVAAIKLAWEKIKDTAKAPVDFVVQTVLNKGLIGGFNKLAKPLGVKELPEIAWPPQGWANGGHTGKGPKYAPAGIVHADEFVVRKEARSRFETKHPGALDHINRHGSLPGHADGGMVWPVGRQYAITQRPSAGHPAYDIGTPEGTPVVAAQKGRVALAGPGFRAPGVWGGNEVHLDHGGGVGSLYAHLNSFMVKAGQMVNQGQAIAASGNTGISSGAHLHFGALNGSRMVSPDPYLNGAALGGEYGGINGGGGEGDGGGFNPLSFLSDMAGNIGDKVRAAVPGGGVMIDAAIGIGKKAIEMALVELPKRLGSFIQSGVENVVQAGKAAYWSPTATRALMHTGDFGPLNLASMLRRLMQESGGDAKAVNNWDSNASAGTPSKGLMQVIPPTFEQHRDKALSSDIFDPMANMVASINYTKSRYGSLRDGWDRAGGYATGGLVFDGGGFLPQGTHMVTHNPKAPDAVLSAEQWSDVKQLAIGSRQGGAAGGQISVTFEAGSIVAGDGVDKEELKELMREVVEELFEEVERRTYA